MKVIFAGTPEFARVALEALHAASFEIGLVLTQPDRPAGRGMKLQASPVKQWAQTQNTAVAQPRSLRLDGKFPDDAKAAKAAIDAVQADVIVVAAYGLILPQWTLESCRLGALNIHASLLPRWRGAAPIHRAIEAGDAESGITIMQMDAGLDTGDMLLVEKQTIASGDTTASLQHKLAALGGQLILKALEIAACGRFKPVLQPVDGISYARKIGKSESQIDWQQSAASIERRIRAFNPFPGASSVLAGEVIKLHSAHVLIADYANKIGAGSILRVQNEGIDVATGDGVLRITQLQKSGAKALPVADFLRGFPMTSGLVFSAPAAVTTP